MPKPTKEDAIFFDSHTEGAFDNMLHQMMIFVYAIKENNQVQLSDGELRQYLDVITDERTAVKSKIDSGITLMPDDLKKFANDLDRAAELLHTHRFKANKEQMVNDLSAQMDDTKRIDTYPEDKQYQDLRNHILSIMEQIHMHAERIRSKATTKEMPTLEKFTHASEHFAAQCRDKILSILA
ncbi:MAG: hypothetical protein ACHQJ6_03980 [Candidatus Berkiellales bacterium]